MFGVRVHVLQNMNTNAVPTPGWSFGWDDSLLEQSWSDHHPQIGLTLLQRLRETNTLHFWTRTGLVPNTKFKAELFVRVLQAAGQVTCQNGVSIGVEQWQESTA